MQLGLHLSNFTYPNGAPALAERPRPASPARPRTSGFTKLSVMDHVWQIHVVGPAGDGHARGLHGARLPRRAHRRAVELLAWVTAAVYREPGLLAKCVTTLDVLSGGRAWLGIGAAWNEEESRRARPAVPAHRRALRAAGGGAADLPADVQRRRVGRTSGRHYTAGPHAELAADAAAPAPADPHRRRRGEEDAADGGAVRAGLQPVPVARARAQARRAARALRRPRPRLRRDREDGDDAVRRQRRREDRHAAGRARAPRRAGHHARARLAQGRRHVHADRDDGRRRSSRPRPPSDGSQRSGHGRPARRRQAGPEAGQQRELAARPTRRARASGVSASGIDAADVLPASTTSTATTAPCSSSRLAMASTMRRLAWCGTNTSIWSAARRRGSAPRVATLCTSATAQRNTCRARPSATPSRPGDLEQRRPARRRCSRPAALMPGRSSAAATTSAAPAPSPNRIDVPEVGGIDQPAHLLGAHDQHGRAPRRCRRARWRR